MGPQGRPDGIAGNIVPFCTNEGSGMGGSERELKKISKGANVASGLSIHGVEAAQSESKVAAWAKKRLLWDDEYEMNIPS